MRCKIITILFLLPLFVKADTINKIIIIDTVTLDFYHKYQIDPISKQKNGFYLMIYKGKTLTKGNFKRGERHGEWQFIGMNDTIQQKGIYNEGKKEGTWEFYYSNGALSCKMSFKNGKKNGTWKGFYKNGTTSFEMNYTNDSITGTHTSYFMNGKVSDIDTYRGDTLNGVSKEYYENGTLKIQKYMKGKKIDSVYLSYYDDNNPYAHFIYKKGNIYNVVLYRTREGKSFDWGNLKDGTGTIRFYDSESKMKSEEQFLNSVLNGPAKYFVKGTLVNEGNFSNGKAEGLWIRNYPSGQLNSKINHTNGKKDGTAEYYFENGQVSQKGLFKNDLKTGLWITYDKDGAIASELNFTNDLLEGDAKYYEKGKISKEGKYVKDIKVHTWKNYDGKGKLLYENDHGYNVREDEKKKIRDNTSQVSPPPPPPPPILSGKPSTEKPEDIFTITERMPEFPGGNDFMYEFLSKNVVYPQIEKEAGIQGTAYVTFTVDNLGEIRDVRILRGVAGGAGCDKESLRIVRMMPRWNPGMQNGRPVSVQFNLPIKFRLK